MSQNDCIGKTLKPWPILVDHYRGGEMLNWTNDSGHFKPTLKEVFNNRIGFIKDILPMEKFIPFDSSEKENSRIVKKRLFTI